MITFNKKLLICWGCLLIENSAGTEEIINKLTDIVKEWKEETIDCDYDEIEDREEEQAISEGYIWGD